MAIATVKDIIWRNSKNGALIPYLQLEIDNASEDNQCVVKKSDTLWIRRNAIASGAILEIELNSFNVPIILKIVKPAFEVAIREMWESLEFCPCCGIPTIWNETNSNIICPNPTCPETKVSQICYFINTTTNDNASISRSLVKKLYEAGYDTVKRLLKITFQELLTIPTIAETHANKLLQIFRQIKNGVNVTDLMLASCCFKFLGEKRIQAILNDMSETERWMFINGYMQLKPSFFQSPRYKHATKTMKIFYDGVSDFYGFIAENELCILNSCLPALTCSLTLTNKTILILGKHGKYIEEEIIRRGGNLSARLTKNVDYILSFKEITDRWQLDFIDRYMIEVMNEDEFSLKFLKN